MCDKKMAAQNVIVLCGSEDGGKFGIPGSLCTLGSSLADGRAQTLAKKISSTCCNDMPSK